MFNTLRSSRIKSIVLLGLLMVSILFVKMIPIEITRSDDVKEALYQLD